MKNKKFLIVGLGLIGGSYAEALTNLGYEVGAIDIDGSSIEYALSKKIIAHGKTNADGSYIGEFDVIISALYPKTFINWIEENQQNFKSGAIITDVTGVKGSVVYKLQKILRSDLEYIGAHPMAGRESSGVQNAKSEIFKGANYIITPTENNTEYAIGFCTDLARQMGFGKISVLSPGQHDEIIGFLSQLAHCIAISLMNCENSQDMANFTGDSFRDLTRIAKINDVMWAELFSLNKDELVNQIDKFSSTLAKLKDYIKNDDIAGMREMMQISTRNRTKFDKK